MHRDATKAGRAIWALILNFSIMEQPVIFTAEMVVSERIDRLSPTIDAQITMPHINGKGIPAATASLIAMGMKAAIDPIDEPIVNEKSEMIMNSPGSKKDTGVTYRLMFTAASIADIFSKM